MPPGGGRRPQGTFSVIATLTAESTKTVTNAGVFNSTGGATLIVKGDFAGITLASTGDKIEFTISLEQT